MNLIMTQGMHHEWTQTDFFTSRGAAGFGFFPAGRLRLSGANMCRAKAGKFFGTREVGRHTFAGQQPGVLGAAIMRQSPVTANQTATTEKQSL